MSAPMISVVIPAYRSGHLMKEALVSVLKQTFQDFEIVLVDNNADHETQSIISSYAKRHPEKIRALPEKTKGVCSARNRGILEFRGRFIALLDDDYIMYPDRLAAQLHMRLAASGGRRHSWLDGCLFV